MKSSLAIISPDSSDEIIGNLHKYGVRALVIPRLAALADPISGHPDLQVFVHENHLFCHRAMPANFLDMISSYCEVHLCSSLPVHPYPDDIFYNIACTGKTAFHRTDRTEPLIKEYLISRKIELRHVKQGYSRCSTLIIDEEHIITADRSIHAEAEKAQIRSLLINPGYVNLPGYKYGFIGGASGTKDDCVFLTGRLDHHPDRVAIIEFIENAGKKIIFLSQETVIDLGSILFL